MAQVAAFGCCSVIRIICIIYQESTQFEAEISTRPTVKVNYCTHQFCSKLLFSTTLELT